jgi:hypothetical protein
MTITVTSPARRTRGAIAALAAGTAMLTAAACGGPAPGGSAAPAVPSLSQPGAATGGGATGGSRAAALHAAAQCIRQHGIPGYQDPVLTPGGQVYTDSRSFENAPQPVVNAIQQACRVPLTRARLTPDGEPPAPPRLVQAGVRSAECLRAHGMLNVQDPTAQSPYTPGHGFGFRGNEMPAGGKASPVYQHAAQACRSLLDAEIRASTLASLGDDG